MSNDHHPSVMQLPDNDYVLSEGSAWFDVKGFAIRIHSTDEGVIVDIYDAKLASEGEFDEGLLASTYAHVNDLESES